MAQVEASGIALKAGYEILELLDTNVSFNEMRKFARQCCAAGLIINDDPTYGNVGKRPNGDVLYIDAGIGSLAMAESPADAELHLKIALNWIADAEVRSLVRQFGKETGLTSEMAEILVETDGIHESAYTHLTRGRQAVDLLTDA